MIIRKFVRGKKSIRKRTRKIGSKGGKRITRKITKSVEKIEVGEVLNEK